MYKMLPVILKTQCPVEIGQVNNGTQVQIIIIKPSKIGKNFILALMKLGLIH